MADHTSSHGPAASLEAALSAQEPFLRGLSRALIADEHGAADAVQDTLLAAWRAPALPQSTSRLRAWLATVLKRRSIDQLRSRSFRSELPLDSETSSPGPDLASSSGGEDTPDAIAERLERQLLLQEATIALAPACRSALVLRYQDGKSAAEIARELGVPAATVRSRIARGLAQLREELDRRAHSRGEEHPRESWLAALTPLAFPELPALPGAAAAGATSTVLVTGLIMKKVVLSLSALAASAAVYLLATGGFTGLEPEPAALATPAAHPAARLVPPDGGGPESSGERVAVGPVSAPFGPESPTQAEVPVARASAISGRVMLMDGTALARMRVLALRAVGMENEVLAEALAGEDGKFTIELGDGHGPDEVTVAADVGTFGSAQANAFLGGRAPYPGSVAKGVVPGREALELRIDAIDARFVVPANRLENAPGAPSQRGFLVARPIHPTSADLKHSISGPWQADLESTQPRLLPVNQQYLVDLTFEGGKWITLLPQGLASGRYEFVLEESRPELASVAITRTGPPSSDGDWPEIEIRLRRHAGAGSAGGERHGRLKLAGSERSAATHAALPGVSTLEASVQGHSKPTWHYVVQECQEIELSAGELSQVEIELAIGGRIEVEIPSTPESEAPEPEVTIVLYRYLTGGPAGDDGSEHIPALLGQSGDGPWESIGLTQAGQTYVVSPALAPGTVEVTVSAGSGEPTKGVLQIVPGQVSTIRVE